jgi:hypothetical protein
LIFIQPVLRRLAPIVLEKGYQIEQGVSMFRHVEPRNTKSIPAAGILFGLAAAVLGSYWALVMRRAICRSIDA